MPKKISESAIIGQRGIHIIGEICASMGFLFYPTGGVEAGIDGHIEIRDHATGEATNLSIQLQSKATQREKLTAETEESFEWPCDQRDITYWLQGNAPVILVVVRVLLREAFWVSIKDYFRDPKIRQRGKVLFDKKKNRFDRFSRDALINLAIPKDSGLYLAPAPKQEKVFSNLLIVSHLPEQIYFGKSKYGDLGLIYRKLDRPNNKAPSEWKLKGDSLISFHDLSQKRWNNVCSPSTVKFQPVASWANSEDPETKKDFVWLLNRALREKTKKDLKFSKSKNCLYFGSTPDLSNRKLAYKSVVKNTSRDVFKGHFNKTTGELKYYKHFAFRGYFKRFGESWYLEITPTYYFTCNGYQRSRFFDENLMSIKRREYQSSVFGQVFMWADYLQEDSQMNILEPAYPFLKFGGLETFEIHHGINDDAWTSNEEDKEFREMGFPLLDEGLIVDELPLFNWNDGN
ncbi:MAG: DUF4365 domain-containing protein [Tildeniella torsiva UHER 1998/13D]|nr:DUF4365 domain-containing protein [Tildeniella torsiva UHER 1998/13D]